MTEAAPLHVCAVLPQRLHRKRSQAGWIATCTVCGPLGKPYEDEDTAKRRALLHVDCWSKLVTS